MVYEASLSGVLRIIFWIIVISFVLRLIARMALPYVVKKAEENMRQRMSDFQQQQQRPQRQEGDVSIQNGGRQQSGSSKDGEYVDYVEIKD
jgi:hypothetical protein